MTLYTLYPTKKEERKLLPPSVLPPSWCRYALSFATQKWLLKLNGMQLCSQQFKSSFCFIDLIQIQVGNPMYLPLQMHERQLQLFFILDGDVIFIDKNKKPFIHIQSNTFFMSYSTKGSCFAKIEKGYYTAIVLGLQPEWITSINGTYSHIQDFLQRFFDNTLPYESMSHHRIDRKIQRWLYRVYSYSEPNKGALDGNLRKYISLILAYYDELAGDRDRDMAHRIRSFIDDNYADMHLDMPSLADRFHMTPRTLRNTFKRRYAISVQQYLSDLRVRKALILMEAEGMAIRDVYMKVGYADERTFRYALKQYQKRNKP